MPFDLLIHRRFIFVTWVEPQAISNLNNNNLNVDICDHVLPYASSERSDGTGKNSLSTQMHLSHFGDKNQGRAEVLMKAGSEQ